MLRSMACPRKQIITCPVELGMGACAKIEFDGRKGIEESEDNEK